MEKKVLLGTIKTSVGTFGAVMTHKGLARLTFPNEPFALCESWVKRRIPDTRLVQDDEQLVNIKAQLIAYFEGRLSNFTLPVDLRGTPFQLQVWQALREIPFGEVRTYSQIADTIGRQNAVRAVGAANGANPIPIIIPCHRVIGSNGKLVGYAGGLDMKSKLLKLEGVLKEGAK